MKFVKFISEKGNENLNNSFIAFKYKHIKIQQLFLLLFWIIFGQPIRRAQKVVQWATLFNVLVSTTYDPSPHAFLIVKHVLRKKRWKRYYKEGNIHELAY